MAYSYVFLKYWMPILNLDDLVDRSPSVFLLGDNDISENGASKIAMRVVGANLQFSAAEYANDAHKDLRAAVDMHPDLWDEEDVLHLCSFLLKKFDVDFGRFEN